MPAPSQITQSDLPECVYTTSRSHRILHLSLTILICLWAAVAAYMWLTDQANWLYFFPPLAFSLFYLMNTYSIFNSDLTFTTDGVRYRAHGGTFFIPWHNIQFDKRRSRLVLTERFKPIEQTRYGRLAITLPISSIFLKAFGWPSEKMRIDLKRYAPHLLAD